MPIDRYGYWYTPGRAIDVPPRKELWDWIYRTYPKPKCDSGGYYLHWEYKPDYVDRCKADAVYKYLHLGEDRKNWLPGYRCAEHRNKEKRDNLKEIKL